MKATSILAIVLGMSVVPVLSLHAQTATISSARARQIALGAVPNNQGITSEKLKTRNGLLVYEFDVEKPGPGHQEIRVDARTGAIVANQHEDDLIGGSAAKVAKTADKAATKIAKTADKVARKADKEADKIFKKEDIGAMNLPINEARAQQIALGRVRNGKIKGVDLERENGVVLWEVEVDTPGKGHDEILIDAHTGVVLEQTHKH